jgi:hypothetical protein
MLAIPSVFSNVFQSDSSQPQVTEVYTQRILSNGVPHHMVGIIDLRFFGRL